MKPRWADRALTVCAYHYTLCTTPEMYYAELKRLKIPPKDWGDGFLGATSHARMQYFQCGGKYIAIVCIDNGNGQYSGIQIAALLCHEAVHIWQQHAVNIGSFNDHGDEEEAYAIQNIAQNLMELYQEQMK